MRFLLLLAIATAAFAQVPDQYTNLQVLPKNITCPELMKIMRGFSFSLGARCVACHAGNPSGALEGMTSRPIRRK